MRTEVTKPDISIFFIKRRFVLFRTLMKGCSELCKVNLSRKLQGNKYVFQNITLYYSTELFIQLIKEQNYFLNGNVRFPLLPPQFWKTNKTVTLPITSKKGLSDHLYWVTLSFQDKRDGVCPPGPVRPCLRGDNISDL